MQGLATIVAIISSTAVIAWRLDEKIDDRAQRVEAVVHQVQATSVARSEFVTLQSEVVSGRETMLKMATDIAAIRALMEHERRRGR